MIESMKKSVQKKKKKICGKKKNIRSTGTRSEGN